jgi:hypothetical protein
LPVANTKGNTGRIQGLKIVSSPPKYDKTQSSKAPPQFKKALHIDDERYCNQDYESKDKRRQAKKREHSI